ncbi:MAG: hypothetical protein AAB049_05745 [Nitrospirota bacterium]
MINNDGKDMELLTSGGLHHSMPGWFSAEIQKVDVQPTEKK